MLAAKFEDEFAFCFSSSFGDGFEDREDSCQRRPDQCQTDSDRDQITHGVEDLLSMSHAIATVAIKLIWLALRNITAAVDKSQPASHTKFRTVPRAPIALYDHKFKVLSARFTERTIYGNNLS